MFSGKNGAVLFTVKGDLGGDRFGTSVDGIGDVNLDGYPDVVVGAPQPSLIGWPGYIKVVSGKDGKVIARINGPAIGDRFGISVSRAGDVDGDSRPDVLVGASQQGMSYGFAVVLSGKTGLVIRKFTGKKTGDEFGFSVDGGVDMNGDGRPDVLVGARFDDRAGANAGVVHLFSGKDSKTLRSFAGDAAGDAFGTSVALAGDIDKDGYRDLLVGARNAKGNGGAFVFSGKDGKRLDAFYGDSKGDAFGATVAALGDTNKDGHADFIVGAPDDDDFNKSCGMARVFSGKDLTLSTDVHLLSLKKAGSQKLTLAAGKSQANRLYHMFGSATGSIPGITINGLHIPLRPDMYTDIAFAYANSTMFGNFRGKLDGTGAATATFRVPTGLPVLVNMTLFHAFVVYDANGAFYVASNAATLRLEN